MKTLIEMTKDERSLLLFLETCAVDYGGTVDTRHMNKSDMDKTKEWTSNGFLSFDRIKFDYITMHRSYWVELSDDAWRLAHEERKARYVRINNKRTWKKTKEA